MRAMAEKEKPNSRGGQSRDGLLSWMMWVLARHGLTIRAGLGGNPWETWGKLG